MGELPIPSHPQSLGPATPARPLKADPQIAQLVSLGSGYIVDLPLTRDEAHKTITSLAVDKWTGA